MTNSITPIFVSVTQAAQMLGVSRPTIYTLLRQGLRSSRIGRVRRIKTVDIVAFMDQHSEEYGAD